MAPKQAEAKTRRSRKARTEVSSSSEASNSSDSEQEPQPGQEPRQHDEEPPNPTSDSFSDDDDGAAQDSDGSKPRFTQRRIDPHQAFEAFYLRQATKEFANDLEKLRAASDFRGGERSVEVIVGALKQGTACFGEEERAKVGGVAAGD